MDSWLKPINLVRDKEILDLPITGAWPSTVFLLTRLHSAWHGTISHRYKGLSWIFEDFTEADEVITARRKQGTYFKLFELSALEVHTQSHRLVVAQINESAPFSQWSSPEAWKDLTRPLTLGDVHSATALKSTANRKGGWSAATLMDDVIIGIEDRAPRVLFPMPAFKRETEVYSSKGVTPGLGDLGENLDLVETVECNLEPLQVMSLAIAKRATQRA